MEPSQGEAGASEDGGDRPGLGRRLEIAAAVLLGLATVFSAWGAYQATRWSGAMAIEFNNAVVLSNDAGKLYQFGDAKHSQDNTVFVAWAASAFGEDSDLPIFLQESLFSEELDRAVEVWAEMDDAPPTPFELEEYAIEEWQLADELEDLSAAAFEDAKDANQQGDDYVLLTVLFASVLFFAGMASTVKAVGIKLTLLAVASVVFVGSAITILTFPVR